MPGRATVAWFEAAPAAAFAPSAFPVFIAQDQETGVPFYGFPEIGGAGGEMTESEGGLWSSAVSREQCSRERAGGRRAGAAAAAAALSPPGAVFFGLLCVA